MSSYVPKYGKCAMFIKLSSNRISKNFFIYDSIDYTNVRNEGSRTIINESKIPVNNGRSQDGLAAQQPFPNHVCFKFSAPSLKRMYTVLFNKINVYLKI